MFDVRDQLLKLLVQAFKQKGLDSVVYKDRLMKEIKEIDAQMKHDYFLDLHKKQCQFEKNENNLLVPYLLGLVDDFDVTEESVYVQGEFPDIDMDYLSVVRDYLKNDWSKKTFGAENICAIGSYQTFKLKSSLIDMARVHGKDVHEIQALTTKIGMKDDEGEQMTWDKAMELYPDLKKYCQENPDVADAAKRLSGRNRGMGMHAAGLIIANQSIDNFVPLTKGKDGAHVSAFAEGQNSTELGPLGLIKFDMLVIANLLQIGICCRLIRERYGFVSICALLGQDDWSDLSYLNDPVALKLADEGRLKGIFQFDSEGIQTLVKRGGVTVFDDLAAYNAMYRPGPLGMGMDRIYIERKRGREKYEIHPLLEPILKSTYGVLCYQEQIMQILRVVGNIPDMHCEIVRKAISKKKFKVFARYKEMFLQNGQKKLGWTLEQITELWTLIEAFSEYGFNKSHSYAYAYLAARCLWLKAHYPLEFFAATLSCEDTEDKVKEYIRDAATMGIEVQKVDLNKSKEVFDITDDKIYTGFANIKGIGLEAAQRIVANQPYSGFEDFLKRFGTEAGVLKPLISLRVFNDASPIKLYSFYEYYRDSVQKLNGINKTFVDSKQKLFEELLYLVSEDRRSGFSLNHLDQAKVCVENFVGDEEISGNKKFIDKLHKLPEFAPYVLQQFGIADTTNFIKVIARYRTSFLKNMIKNQETILVKLDDFEESDIGDEDFKELLVEIPQLAESKFYGFCWNHLLTTSPDYAGGRSFADFDNDATAYIRMCELHVVDQPKEKKSVKGTSYFTIMMEDENSRSQSITFWDEDYQRFKEELEYWEGNVRKGNFIRIRLKRPEPPFKNYTFDSPPKHLRWKEVAKEKADDFRLLVMKKSESVKQEIMVKPVNALSNRIINLNDIMVIE